MYKIFQKRLTSRARQRGSANQPSELPRPGGGNPSGSRSSKSPTAPQQPVHSSPADATWVYQMYEEGVKSVLDGMEEMKSVLEGMEGMKSVLASQRADALEAPSSSDATPQNTSDSVRSASASFTSPMLLLTREQLPSPITDRDGTSQADTSTRSSVPESVSPGVFTPLLTSTPTNRSSNSCFAATDSESPWPSTTPSAGRGRTSNATTSTGSSRFPFPFRPMFTSTPHGGDRTSSAATSTGRSDSKSAPVQSSMLQDSVEEAPVPRSSFATCISRPLQEQLPSRTPDTEDLSTVTASTQASACQLVEQPSFEWDFSSFESDGEENSSGNSSSFRIISEAGSPLLSVRLQMPDSVVVHTGQTKSEGSSGSSSGSSSSGGGGDSSTSPKLPSPLSSSSKEQPPTGDGRGAGKRNVGCCYNYEPFQPWLLNRNYYPDPGQTISNEPARKSWVDIDKVESRNPGYASEYAEDIDQFLRSQEDKYHLDDVLCRHSEVTVEMWTAMMNWLVHMQKDTGFCNDTLHLAARLLNVFLAQCKMSVRGDLFPLMGLTALVIACKFEEDRAIYQIEVFFLKKSGWRQYSKRCVQRMERVILNTLGFNADIPTVCHFLRRYAKAAMMAIDVYSLALYICEMSMLRYDLATVKPSLLAAAAIYLALSMRGLQGWTPTLQHYTQMPLREVVLVASSLNNMLKHTQGNAYFSSIRQKYSTKENFEVASLEPLSNEKMHKLASIR